MEANEASQMLKKILKVDGIGNYRPVVNGPTKCRLDPTEHVHPNAAYLSVLSLLSIHFVAVVTRSENFSLLTNTSARYRI